MPCCVFPIIALRDLSRCTVVLFFLQTYRRGEAGKLLQAEVSLGRQCKPYTSELAIGGARGSAALLYCFTGSWCCVEQWHTEHSWVSKEECLHLPTPTELLCVELPVLELRDLPASTS